MAAGSAVVEAPREAAFEAFRAEFTRNGFNVPEGLISLLEKFTQKPGEGPEESRARLYRDLWAKLWFGSNRSLGAHVGGQPTYVFPPSLKRVVRESIPGQLIDQPDPTHSRMYKVSIADLSAAKWPVGKKKKT